MLVKASELSVDIEMIEKFLRVACIFRVDPMGRGENLGRTGRQVAEITNRRRNKVKRPASACLEGLLSPGYFYLRLKLDTDHIKTALLPDEVVSMVSQKELARPTQPADFCGGHSFEGMDISTASTRPNFNEAQTPFVERYDIDLMTFDDNVTPDDFETRVL